MAFKFLTYTDRSGTEHLCEGGVYTDDAALLAASDEYPSHDFARAAADLTELGSTSYALRDTLDGVDTADEDVLSSLVAWQLDALS